jgi:hypothetical protein
VGSVRGLELVPAGQGGREFGGGPVDRAQVQPGQQGGQDADLVDGTVAQRPAAARFVRKKRRSISPNGQWYYGLGPTPGCPRRSTAAALHSGDPAYGALPGYFMQRLEPALASLLEAAIASGEIRAGISARDLLHAAANLCMPVPDEGPAYSQRMVALLIDGLRYGTDTSQSRP